jgi:predicted nucleotidyltransferase
MLNKNIIFENVKIINDKYQSLGFKITGLFGSYSRDEQDEFSDVDLTYKINHTIFHKDNAFAKLSKLEEIKKELEKIFSKKVDLIPENTKNRFIQESLKNEKIAI